jgi:hypothetical protein
MSMPQEILQRELMKLVNMPQWEQSELSLASNIVLNLQQGQIKKQKKHIIKIEEAGCDFDVSDNEGSSSVAKQIKEQPMVVPVLALKEDLLNFSTLIQTHEQIRR